MQEKTAFESFNRISDPVIDQDNAKILGALGGGYGAWKHHGSSIAKRPGLFDRMAGRAASPITRPTRALVGAGIGALAAGTLARFVNKENKEDHEVAMAQVKAMQAPQYPMYSYASEKIANLYDANENTKTDKMVGKGIRGGLLGALAGAILGGKALKGAGLGAAVGAGHEAYTQYRDQKDAPSQIQQLSMYPQYNNQDAAYNKYAHIVKEAKYFDLFPALKVKAKAGVSNAKNISAEKAKMLRKNADKFKYEMTTNAPDVDAVGRSLKDKKS